ncbi:4'-phosphopantetheinyl transferase [Lanmaoa asiatica]|nr:4'-phosphopantetheinyl transferase [Lanmaoa asiatica]
MTIHGIGVDLLHVPRMAALVNRRGAKRVASRILSPSERNAFGRLWPENLPWMHAATQFLGVRWAVKEAAYKALYPLRPTWKELTYTTFDPQTRSKPALVFHPRGGDIFGLHVSVSHDGEYILAHVLAENVA